MAVCGRFYPAVFARPKAQYLGLRESLRPADRRASDTASLLAVTQQVLRCECFAEAARCLVNACEIWLDVQASILTWSWGQTTVAQRPAAVATEVQRGTDTEDRQPGPTVSSLPIVVDRRIQGALEISRASGLNDEDLQRAATLAELAGWALRRSQTLAALKRSQALYQCRLREVRKQASRDSLTQVSNHRAVRERMQIEIERSNRSGVAFAILMIDVEHFKAVNDRYGHLVGDQVLKGIAHELCARSRRVDLVGRVGGDEFVVILPYTDHRQAQMKAETLKTAIRGHHFVAVGQRLSMGLSIGTAGFPEDGATVDALLEAADRAMYRNKALKR